MEKNFKVNETVKNAVNVILKDLYDNHENDLREILKYREWNLPITEDKLNELLTTRTCNCYRFALMLMRAYLNSHQSIMAPFEDRLSSIPEDRTGYLSSSVSEVKSLPAGSYRISCTPLLCKHYLIMILMASMVKSELKVDKLNYDDLMTIKDSMNGRNKKSSSLLCFILDDVRGINNGIRLSFLLNY